MGNRKNKKLSVFFLMTALTIPVFGSSDPSADISSDDEHLMGININGSTVISSNKQVKKAVEMSFKKGFEDSLLMDLANKAGGEDYYFNYDFESLPRTFLEQFSIGNLKPYPESSEDLGIALFQLKKERIFEKLPFLPCTAKEISSGLFFPDNFSLFQEFAKTNNTNIICVDIKGTNYLERAVVMSRNGAIQEIEADDFDTKTDANVRTFLQKSDFVQEVLKDQLERENTIILVRSSGNLFVGCFTTKKFFSKLIKMPSQEQLFVSKCMALLAKDYDCDLKDREFVWCPNIIDKKGSFSFCNKANLSLYATGFKEYKHFPVIFSYKNWSKNWWDDVKKFFGELGYKTEKWQALTNIHLNTDKHIVYLQYYGSVNYRKILTIMPSNGSAYTGRDDNRLQNDYGAHYSTDEVLSDSPAIKEIFKSDDGIEDTVFILHDAKNGRVSFGFFPSTEENIELYSMLYSAYLSSDQEISSPELPWPWDQQVGQFEEQISDIHERSTTTSPGIESLGTGLERQSSEVSTASKRSFSNEYSGSEYYSDDDYSETEEHSQESSPELSEDERSGTSIGNNETSAPSSANTREQQMEQLRERFVAFRLGYLFDQDRLRFLQAEKTGKPYEPIFDIRLNAFSKTLQRKLVIGNCYLFNLSAQAKDVGSIVLASFRGQKFPVERGKADKDINQIFDMNQILGALSLDGQNIAPVSSFSANDLQRVAHQCGMNVIYVEIGDGITLKPDFFERSIVAISNGIAPSERKSGKLGDDTVRQALIGGDEIIRTIFEKMDRFCNTLVLLNHKANNRLYFGFLSKETYSELLDPSENKLTETARKIDNVQWYKNTASKAASTAVGIYSFVSGVSRMMNPFVTGANLLLRWKCPDMFKNTVDHNHVHTFTFDSGSGPFETGDELLTLPE